MLSVEMSALLTQLDRIEFGSVTLERTGLGGLAALDGMDRANALDGQRLREKTISAATLHDRKLKPKAKTLHPTP